LQEVIAKHAATKGFVWHTLLSNQNREPGPIVPVHLIRNNLQSPDSRPNGQQTEGRAARYNQPRNNFDVWFLTATTNNQMQTMKVFELRACMQALIDYLKLMKHFPTDQQEISQLNEASKELFDTFMQITPFRAKNEHWRNLRKSHDVRKLFISAHSVEEAEAKTALWRKVFQTADHPTRSNLNHLLAAINEDGELQVALYTLEDSSFAWPTIDMGEVESEEQDVQQWDNDSWILEVNQLLSTTVLKPFVKHQVQAIHRLWHQKLHAMQFVGEGEEDDFTADLWNRLHTFTNNHKDWQDQNTLKSYLFRHKI
jgi:hypothetical protein